MTRIAAISILVWTAAVAICSFMCGRAVEVAANQAERAERLENESELTRLQNRKSLAAGVRTEQAQAKTDQFFQQLRADYESDQREDPGIGCVLDPVSLRRWNEANAHATGEPPAELRDASEPEAWGKRRE